MLAAPVSKLKKAAVEALTAERRRGAARRVARLPELDADEDRGEEQAFKQLPRQCGGALIAQDGLERVAASKVLHLGFMSSLCRAGTSVRAAPNPP